MTSGTRATLAIILIGVISVMCRISMESIQEERPDVATIMRSPEQYHGAPVYIKGVVKEEKDGLYRLDCDGFPVDVKTGDKLQGGSNVMVVGKSHRDGYIEAARTREVPKVMLKSYISYLLAAVVLIIFMCQLFSNYRVKGWQIY